VAARFFPDMPRRTFFGVDKGVMESDKSLQSGTANAVDFMYVSLIDYFCTKEGCLVHHGEGNPESLTSWDYGHLTPVASYHLAKDVLVPLITGK
jgi:hypothetical protein